jgi:hypothetical protein
MGVSLPTLMIAFCFPSLTSAWCGGGIAVGVGVGVVVRPPSTKSRLSHENCRDPIPRRDCHVRSSPRRDRPNIAVFELWSSANDDDDDDGDVDIDVNVGDGAMTTTDDDGGGDQEQMTLAKASRLLSTFWSMAFPYYEESRPGRRLFYGMILLTLVNSAVSVAFSYISKDFWNALSSKDAVEFYAMMIKFGGALVVGAPVSVLYR